MSHVRLRARRSRELRKGDLNRPGSSRRQSYRRGRPDLDSRRLLLDPYGRAGGATGGGGIGGVSDAADDLFIFSILPEIDRTISETEFLTKALISEIAASWAGQHFYIVSSSGLTTSTRKPSTRATNLLYSSLLNSGSVHRGWSGP